MKKLIETIQENYLDIANIRITKKEIQNNILPIFLYLNNSKNNMFLLSGSQGIGKTTIIKILKKNFYKYFNKRILALSLDDFYFDKNEREKISKLSHPLMKTRGVPGTHNVKEILNVIEKFKKKKYPMKIPKFDKLKDIKLKENIIQNKCDILILEGWCCGSPAIKKSYLYKNINNLEKNYDKFFVWRNYYNECLKKDYSKLFKRFDKLIYFKAPSFSCILKWRFKQENYMKKNAKNINLGMNKNEIKNFILYYEKLTKWMIRILPQEANLTIFVDKNQRIKKISIF